MWVDAGTLRSVELLPSFDGSPTPVRAAVHPTLHRIAATQQIPVHELDEMAKPRSSRPSTLTDWTKYRALSG
jgi:hypothetical protein